MATASVRLVHLRLDTELLKWLDHQTVELDVWRTALIEAVLKNTRLRVTNGKLDLADELAEQLAPREKEAVEA